MSFVPSSNAAETAPPFMLPPALAAEPAPLNDTLRDKLLATMMESARGLVCVFQLPDLRLAYLNPAAKARLNPDGQADMLKLTLGECVSVSSHQRLQAEILPHARVRGTWSGECELRDVWGGEFPVTLTCVVHGQGRGRPAYLCLLAAEKTPVETEEARFNDRQLLHALLAHVPDSIYFKDTASRFRRMSHAQARKFGLNDPAEAIGKTDFDFFTAEHASAAYADEQEIIRSGQPIIDREEKETWEDGHTTWVSSTKLPLRDTSGRIIGSFGISRDVTARKLSEQAQREMEMQLQLSQKMESIGRLAAGIAHEVNTPTQFIADNTHFLMDAFTKFEALRTHYRALCTAAAAHPDCAAAIAAVETAEQESEMDYLSAEIPRCLQQSLDGLARVARIVCSLKEFAHPNSPDLVPADLNRTIETALVVSRHEWKYVAETAAELDPDLPLVPCVVDEFNQVILNLVINAAHAIGDAAKSRPGERGRITVRTRQAAPWAIVEVEDNGTGIPPEIRGRIFEPFFTTKAVGKGTGQGLAIVHTVIVKHHHGSIDVETEPGRGTKFILRLPLAVPAPATPAAPAH